MEIRRYYDHLISTIQPSYLHSGISYTGKMTFLYKIWAQQVPHHFWIHISINFLNEIQFEYSICRYERMYSDQPVLIFTRETYQWSQSVVVGTGTLPYICMVSRCELYPCKVGCYYRYLSNPPRLLNPKMTMSRMKLFLHVLSES